tara:strand:- start:788 stop:1693 length:906 start_codon:yes stop_codon:yes gene_type:complete
MKRLLLKILFLLFTTSLFSQNNGDLYLGILETKFVSSKDTSRIKIQRILFKFENNKWYSLENDIADSSLYPSQKKWIIAFDGRNIGSFSSNMAPLKYKAVPWTFPRDAYHIPNKVDLPTIGSPSMEFSGWVGYAQPRPLVTVTDTNYSDPEQWKPFKPNRNEITELASLYEKHFKNMEFGWVDTVIHSKLEFGKSYISSESNKLLQFGILDSVNGKEYLSNRIWIYKSNSGEIIDLSKAIDFPFKGHGDSEISNLYLVDAGDYDNDGYSEVVFWIDRYNGNGYALFYNNFSSHVSFEWNYH